MVFGMPTVLGPRDGMEDFDDYVGFGVWGLWSKFKESMAGLKTNKRVYVKAYHVVYQGDWNAGSMSFHGLPFF